MVLFDADGGHDVRYLREPWNDDLGLVDNKHSQEFAAIVEPSYEKPI